MTKSKSPAPRRRTPRATPAARTERHLENIFGVVGAWQDYGERAGASSSNAIASLLGHVDWSLASRATIVGVFTATLKGLPESAIAELSKHADEERKILIQCGGADDFVVRMTAMFQKLKLRPKAFRAATKAIKAMAADKAGRR